MNASDSLVPAAVEARARAYKRVGVAFGRRFFVLLLIGLLWLVPGYIEPRFLYGMVAWDGIVIIAWTIDLRRLPGPSQLEVRRRWKSAAALSVASEIEITVANHSRTGVYARLVDDIPTQLRSRPAQLAFKVPARGEAAATCSIIPVRRGEVELGSAYLRYESAFRMAQRWAEAPLKQSVRVYPDLDEAKRHAVYLLRSRQIEMEKRYARIRGAGREFESLREYRQGDELRDVCWTATARRGNLVTRLYQIERSQTVWIVVDCGRLMRARVAGLSKLDYAVNAGLSLAEVALYSGDRVGLLAYGHGVRHRVPAARGSSHLRAMIDSLALVSEETAEADHLQAAGVLLAAQKRRSLIVWLTDLAETAMTPEVVEAAMQMMLRHLVLFVVIGQPDLGELAAREPSNVGEMFQTTAAQEMMHRRELLLARLRERGALALEANSRALSLALVNSYLEIKERSRL